MMVHRRLAVVFLALGLLLVQAAFSQNAPVRAFPVGGPDFEMTLVRGGRFRMGCQSASDPCLDDERPIHEVRLNDFFIGKRPVTQGQWRAVMGANPSHFSGDDNRPVEQVSWNDVQAFIEKLNGITGLRYRLPTEAEWEFAARGGMEAQGKVRVPKPKKPKKGKDDGADSVAVDDGSGGAGQSEAGAGQSEADAGQSEADAAASRFSGNRFLDDIAWYDYNSGGTTHPVGQKKPNELGLYDMVGNVWEWVNDRYDRYYYRNSPLKNPTGPRHGADRVYRGNSFMSEEKHCRLSIRNYNKPDHRSIDVGFRLARSP